jgi:hypothetical protein
MVFTLRNLEAFAQPCHLEFVFLDGTELLGRTKVPLPPVVDSPELEWDYSETRPLHHYDHHHHEAEKSGHPEGCLHSVNARHEISTVLVAAHLERRAWHWARSAADEAAAELPPRASLPPGVVTLTVLQALDLTPADVGGSR